MGKPFTAVFLTALKVEFKAVQQHLIKAQEQNYNGTVYETGMFSANDQNWKVHIAELGVGNPVAAAETERAINYFDPSYIFFVGIAGGLKDVQIGDVVAATKVYEYESGKAQTSFNPRPELINSSHILVQRARAVARKEMWISRINSQHSVQPQAFLGPIAAGAKVISSTSSNVYQLIQRNYGDALAVEMEGFGFLQAAHINPSVEAIVIRGISDLLENKSKTDLEGNQSIAAHHASAFAFELLANLAIDEQVEIIFSNHQEQGVLLNREQKLLLANLITRSGRANRVGERSALCMAIGLDVGVLDFIETVTPNSFSIQLVEHLQQTGNCEALMALADNDCLKLSGQVLQQLSFIRNLLLRVCS